MITIRLEDIKDYRIVEEITRKAFSYSGRIERLGVGSELIYAMISKSKNLGFGAILFFGRPEYYPQFGFKEASIFGVADSNGDNYSAFMAMELIDGYLSNASNGRYFESDIYTDDLNRDKVVDFDKTFR